MALIPFLLWRHVPLFTFNPAVWPQILYLTVLVTALAYYCYFVGLSLLDTSLGATVFFVKPLLAALLAAAVLGERLTPGLATGALLVLASICLVQRGGRRVPAPGIHLRRGTHPADGSGARPLPSAPGYPSGGWVWRSAARRCGVAKAGGIEIAASGTEPGGSKDSG
jgi:hypothetical protein